MGREIPRTPREEVGLWLGRVNRVRYRLNERRLEEIGVGPGQVPILTELNYHGQLTQRELAEHTHVTAATISGTLKRMEKAGIVHRCEAEQDARVSIVTLTETGKQVAAEAQKMFDRTDHDMLVCFTEEECASLATVLTRMRDNLIRAEEKEKEER